MPEDDGRPRLRTHHRNKLDLAGKCRHGTTTTGIGMTSEPPCPKQLAETKQIANLKPAEKDKHTPDPTAISFTCWPSLPLSTSSLGPPCNQAVKTQLPRLQHYKSLGPPLLSHCYTGVYSGFAGSFIQNISVWGTMWLEPLNFSH